MSTVGERVRAIKIEVPSRQSLRSKPLSANDQAVLSSVVRGVLQWRANRWVSATSAHQGISTTSIRRLVTRGYLTAGTDPKKPSLLATEAGLKALGKA